MSTPTKTDNGMVETPNGQVLSAWEAATLGRALLEIAGTFGRFKPCEGCGVAVLWARTEKGHPQPVDIGDHPRGNMAVRFVAGQCRVRTLSKAAPELREGEHRVMPHHASCPRADQFRKTKR